MAKGTIASYDADSGEGEITPDGDGDALSFDEDSLVDHRNAEDLRNGDEVTYEEEDGRATEVRHIAPRGYG